MNSNVMMLIKLQIRVKGKLILLIIEGFYPAQYALQGVKRLVMSVCHAKKIGINTLEYSSKLISQLEDSHIRTYAYLPTLEYFKHLLNSSVS